MNTRKVLSLALALVLTLGLAAPAMAAGMPDIPVPGVPNAYSSEECIRTEAYSHRGVERELLIYPEGTAFKHSSAASNDRCEEADDPKTEKGIASYGSTFQLPKTDIVFIITFGDYMMPNDGMVYVKLEGKGQPAESTEPAETPAPVTSAPTANQEQYYIMGAEMQGVVDREPLGTSETKPENLFYNPPFANLVPVGTVVNGEGGETCEISVYHGDTMEPFTDEEYLALMGTDNAMSPLTVTTEDYYLLGCDFGAVLVKGVADGGAAPADSTPADVEVVDFTATPSTKTVKVDGKPVEFQFYSTKNYIGVVTEYVKLRDVASVLNGTSAQFNVTWDGGVNLVPGEAYIPNGSEMQTPFSGERTFSYPTTDTKVAGQVVDLDAIVLTDDQGGGFTYYPLSLLGLALGFEGGIDVAEGWVIKTK